MKHKSLKSKKTVKKILLKTEKNTQKTKKIRQEKSTQRNVFEEVISEVAGPDVLQLVKALKNKSNVSEFKLASTLRQEINTVRNMLYRLYNANLVTFMRKKDQKKGWYIYYWTFNTKNIHHLAEEIKKKKIEKLSERLN